MARKARVARDERTQTMSEEALNCRSFGHAWRRVPPTAQERLEYRKKGQRLVLLECSNGCTYERTIVIDRSNGETVSDRGRYGEPKNYLVQQQGAGRVPKQAVRVALFAAIGDD